MSADKEVHNQHDHQILLSGIALDNQQGQDHQPVIIGAGLFEQVVLFQEQQEEKGANCPDSSPRTRRTPLSALMNFPVRL